MQEPKSSVITTDKQLPFLELSAAEFERLCLWLVEHEGYSRAEHWGEAGYPRLPFRCPNARGGKPATKTTQAVHAGRPKEENHTACATRRGPAFGIGIPRMTFRNALQTGTRRSWRSGFIIAFPFLGSPACQNTPWLLETAIPLQISESTPHSKGMPITRLSLHETAVAAGFPSLTDDYVETPLDLNDRLVPIRPSCLQKSLRMLSDFGRTRLQDASTWHRICPEGIRRTR